MSAENPRYYKFYPPTETTTYEGTLQDLIVGDYTVHSNDRIIVPDESGIYTTYFQHATTGVIGRTVTTKVGGRIRQVWTPGIIFKPIIYQETGEIAPWWLSLCNDPHGVVCLKIPDVEEVEEVPT